MANTTFRFNQKDMFSLNIEYKFVLIVIFVK